jgi:hypothetical protein
MTAGETGWPMRDEESASLCRIDEGSTMRSTTRSAVIVATAVQTATKLRFLCLALALALLLSKERHPNVPPFGRLRERDWLI